MFVLLFTACTMVAAADPPNYDTGDWGALAERIIQLEEGGQLIDTQPIVTIPEEAIEPEVPIQVEAPEEGLIDTEE